MWSLSLADLFSGRFGTRDSSKKWVSAGWNFGKRLVVFVNFTCKKSSLSSSNLDSAGTVKWFLFLGAICNHSKSNLFYFNLRNLSNCEKCLETKKSNRFTESDSELSGLSGAKFSNRPRDDSVLLIKAIYFQRAHGSSMIVSFKTTPLEKNFFLSLL